MSGDTARLLVLADDRREAQQLLSVLGTGGEDADVSLDRTADATRFAAFQQRIVLLCMVEPQTALEAYLHMLRQSAGNGVPAHQCLLLCATRHVRWACELALDDIVDDYLIYWPLVDPACLRFAVHQARRRHERERLVAALGAQGSRREEVEQVRAFVSRSTAGGRRLLKQDRDALAGLERDVRSTTTEFRDHLLEQRFADAMTVTDPRRAARHVESDLQQPLASRLARFDAAVTESHRDWQQRLEADGEETARQLAAHAPAVARPPRVLVADDDAEVRRVLERMLRTGDLDVGSAGDATHLRLQCARQTPDLILMDVQFGRDDGLALTASLKADPALAAIPVILVTGHASAEVVRRGVAAGAVDCVVKPIDRVVLLQKIERVLAARLGTERAAVRLDAGPRR